MVIFDNYINTTILQINQINFPEHKPDFTCPPIFVPAFYSHVEVGMFVKFRVGKCSCYGKIISTKYNDTGITSLNVNQFILLPKFNKITNNDCIQPLINIYVDVKD